MNDGVPTNVLFGIFGFDISRDGLANDESQFNFIIQFRGQSAITNDRGLTGVGKRKCQYRQHKERK